MAYFFLVFAIRQGKNLVDRKKNETRSATTTVQALFTPVFKAQLVALLLQRSQHPKYCATITMKMADDDASMATMGGSGKVTPMLLLLPAVEATLSGNPGRKWGCCTIIGLHGHDWVPLICGSMWPRVRVLHEVRHDDVPTDMFVLTSVICGGR